MTKAVGHRMRRRAVGEMVAYASRTGTRRNLDALRRAGWRLIVSAAGAWRNEGFRYALDNGAWSAFVAGARFDAGRFRACVAQMGAGADWIVVPDIVCGGRESLRFSLSWLDEILMVGPPVLLAVQNGMKASDLRHHVGGRVGLFVGGDTAWKEATLPVWGRLARERTCYLHVGRVNSARRIRLCAMAGADSFDGSSASRYSKTVGALDAARRQVALEIDLL